MNFYTNAFQMGNHIFVRGIDGGRRFKQKVEYSPFLFVSSKKEDAEYKTLTGNPVDKINFGSIKEAKEFVETYDGVSNMNIYGLDNFLYCYLNEEYPNEIRYDKEQLNIGTLDIEVESDTGFPDPDKAEKL